MTTLTVKTHSFYSFFTYLHGLTLCGQLGFPLNLSWICTADIYPPSCSYLQLQNLLQDDTSSCGLWEPLCGLPCSCILHMNNPSLHCEDSRHVFPELAFENLWRSCLVQQRCIFYIGIFPIGHVHELLLCAWSRNALLMPRNYIFDRQSSGHILYHDCPF